MSTFLFGALSPGVEVMSQLAYGDLTPNVVVTDLVVKTKVPVATNSVSNRTVTVTVPTSDPATQIAPIAVHACYVTTAPDTASVSAADFLTNTPDFNKASVPVTVPGPLTINLLNVPAGTYFCQTVIEYPD